MKHVLLFCVLFSISTNQGICETPKVVVFDGGHLVKQPHEKQHSAYAFADVNVDFEDLYQIYKDNTKKIEDEYFSEKITVKEDPKNNFFHYHLKFSYWLAGGQLFFLEEKHQKLFNEEWWTVSHSGVFPGKQKADMWTVKKYLLPETKNSWVGDSLKYVRIRISFIDMGKNKTRIFFHTVIDAKYHRSLPEVKNTVVKSVVDILRVAGIKDFEREDAE